MQRDGGKADIEKLTNYIAYKLGDDGVFEKEGSSPTDNVASMAISKATGSSQENIIEINLIGDAPDFALNNLKNVIDDINKERAARSINQVSSKVNTPDFPQTNLQIIIGEINKVNLDSLKNKESAGDITISSRVTGEKTGEIHPHPITKYASVEVVFPENDVKASVAAMLNRAQQDRAAFMESQKAFCELQKD